MTSPKKETILLNDFWVFFFLIKKNNICVSVQKVVCCSHQSNRLGYVSRTNQIAALGYISRTNQSVVSVLWFERCSNFDEVMRDSERVVRKLESSFRMRNVGFSVFLTCNFPAFYEKCDATGQMKDVRLPIVNVLLVLWKWWIVVRKKIEFCALYRDHGYCSFTTRVSEKFFNQILLEVLMSCTKHFDLSSSLTASCVARFMICWVCRLYLFGLVY